MLKFAPKISHFWVVYRCVLIFISKTRIRLTLRENVCTHNETVTSTQPHTNACTWQLASTYSVDWRMAKGIILHYYYTTQTM